MAATAVSSTPTLKRHPLRGAFYGLLLGIGLATYLIIFSVIVFQLTIPIIVVLACVMLGVLWAMFAPAKDAPAIPPVAGMRSVAGEPTFAPPATTAPDTAVSAPPPPTEMASGTPDRTVAPHEPPPPAPDPPSSAGPA